jgi:AcrR family transcriptional regulator
MGRPPQVVREQLLAAARDVFSARGYEGATLAEIARALGVTAAAIHRHAGSKADLFVEAMTAADDLPPFIRALETIDPRTDPRRVLRELATQFIPFAMRKMAENVALYMHNHSERKPLIQTFDTGRRDSPPRRGLRIVEKYFERAEEAGVLHVRDARAAALLFMGSLQSYALMHQILKVQPKPFPVDTYIETLLDIWTRGAIVAKPERRTNIGSKEIRSR